MDSNLEFNRCVARSKSSGPDFLGFALGEIDFGRAQDCIKKGLDYHKTRSSNIGPLGEVIQHVNEETQTRELIELMLAAGMNPLTAPEKDQVSLFKRDHVRRQIGDAMTLAETLGKGLRDEQGGNYYHAMAKFGPGFLLDCLSDLIGGEEDEPTPYQSVLDCHRQWARSLNDRGENLLHILWEADFITRWDSGAPQQATVDTFSRRAADSTMVLMALGVDPVAPRRDGTRPLDLMEKQDWSRLDGVHREIFERVRAMTEAELLGNRTPGAPRRSSGSNRL